LNLKHLRNLISLRSVKGYYVLNIPLKSTIMPLDQAYRLIKRNQPNCHIKI